MTPETKPDYIGQFELYVDAERFDQTEVLKVGDKTFVKKEKVLEMMEAWDEKVKSRYAEKLEAAEQENARINTEHNHLISEWEILKAKKDQFEQENKRLREVLTDLKYWYEELGHGRVTMNYDALEKANKAVKPTNP